MAVSKDRSDRTHFLVRRSQLSTSKLFVEFYLPEYQEKLEGLINAPHPLKPLREVASRLFDGPFGSNRKVDMYQDSGIPYIRVKDVLPTGIDLSEITYISEEKHQALNRSRVVPGNVLMTIAGRVGTAAIFPNSLREGNITGHIVGIELPEDVNPHYISAFINSKFGEFQVARLSHRTTRPELNLREVGSILISVPPRSLQDQIAQEMQEAYRNRQKKLKRFESVINSINEYVLERLGINWSEIEDIKRFTVPMSKLARSRFDVSYQSPRASHALRLLAEAGHRVTPLRQLVKEIHYGASVKNDYSADGIPFLRIGNLKPNSLDTSDILYFDETKRKELGRAFIRENDLLMSRSGTVGIVAVVPPEATGFAFGSYQIKFRLKDKIINPFFIAYFLNSPLGNAQIEQQKTGSIQTNITIEGIKALQVPLLALELQDEIVREADRLRSEAKQLQIEAEAVVVAAKARVEQMILGEVLQAVDESA